MGKDRTAKVVVIGEMGVGKTCLLLRFTDNKFPATPIVTIGADFKKRSLDVDGTRISMEVWDTAGQERYKSLTSRFFRHSNGVMLVYDVTDMKSFLRIQNWLDEVDHHEINRSRCLLVGNKVDLSHRRVVEQSQVTALAARHCLAHTETSAKDNRNVQHAFSTLAKQMLAHMKDAADHAMIDHERIVVSLKLQSNADEKIKKKKRSCACDLT